MKEKPILLNAEMVRAVLDGRKTQTRRIAPISQLKIEPYERDMVTWNVQFSKAFKGVTGSYSGGRLSESEAKRVIASQFCPFGAVGDRLWVRETFAGHYIDDDQIQDIKDGRDKASDLCEYRADYPSGAQALEGWTPSIHMPRWASRITLEITGVRVERLQDISEGDAKAEGLAEITKDGSLFKFGIPDRDGYPGNDDNGWPWTEWERNPVDAYRKLWQSIYGADSWQANPWVWVIEFKRVED